jgi:hypothetical protein
MMVASLADSFFVANDCYEPGSTFLFRVLCWMFYEASWKLFSVPAICLIAVLLLSFLEKTKSTERTPFVKRFAISATASFTTIVVSVMILWPAIIANRTWHRFYGQYWLIDLVMVTLSACVYAMIFGLFFGSQTRASRAAIVYQSSIISILMLLWYGLITIVGHMIGPV